MLDDRDALAALLGGCATLDEAAARVGCSVSTLRVRARKLGIPPRRPGRKSSLALTDRDALAELIASGMLTGQIAERVGRSTAVVRYWIRHHGLEFPQHSRRLVDPPQLRDPDWLRREYHDRGRPLVDIGRELGRSATLVARRFRELGIPDPSAAHLSAAARRGVARGTIRCRQLVRRKSPPRWDARTVRCGRRRSRRASRRVRDADARRGPLPLPRGCVPSYGRW